MTLNPDHNPNADPNPGLEEEGERTAVQGSAGTGQQQSAANPNPKLNPKEGNIIPIFSACMAISMYMNTTQTQHKINKRCLQHITNNSTHHKQEDKQANKQPIHQTIQYLTKPDQTSFFK